MLILTVYIYAPPPLTPGLRRKGVDASLKFLLKTQTIIIIKLSYYSFYYYYTYIHSRKNKTVYDTKLVKILQCTYKNALFLI